MAQGVSSYVSFSGSNGYNIRVYFDQTFSETTRISTVSIAKIGIQSNYYVGYATYVDGIIKVNGVVVCTLLGNHGVVPLKSSEWYYMNVSGSTTIEHSSDGSSSISISVHSNNYSNFRLRSSGGSSYNDGIADGQSRNAGLTPVPVYTLTISAGVGSGITVNRTYSPGGATGLLSNGANLWNNDKLKITFVPEANYKILNGTVNNSGFTSGNTYVVNSNVLITAVAQPLASEISATDANIESASIIVITEYDSSYRHTITYNFGDLTGTIAEGSDQTTISWIVPSQFYSQIPNSSSGKCTLTCSTYSGSTLLGSNSCMITVTAPNDSCKPLLSGTVSDIDPNTVHLTGDPSVLIRYKSDASCVINASSRNGAALVSTTINGCAPDSTNSFTQEDVSVSDFVFCATDSRGYFATLTVKPTIVPYVRLTINPIIDRSNPTTGEVVMSFKGNYYNGNFGAHTNTLTVRYRYRKTSEAAFCAWINVPAEVYLIGTSSYYTPSPFSLGTNFDYQQPYVFEIQAYDGADDIILDTADAICPVQKGLPVFDWGENDFNFNVEVKINEVGIFDIFYPIHSVFTSTADTIPEPLASMGTWISLPANADGLYSWTRTA